MILPKNIRSNRSGLKRSDSSSDSSTCSSSSSTNSPSFFKRSLTSLKGKSKKTSTPVESQVSFDDNNQVTHAYEGPLDFDKAEVWYNGSELKSIHLDNKRLVVQLLGGECVEESDEQTLDGLEQYVKAKERAERRRRACEAVLEAQSRSQRKGLRRTGTANADKIARVYREAQRE